MACGAFAVPVKAVFFVGIGDGGITDQRLEDVHVNRRAVLSSLTSSGNSALRRAILAAIRSADWASGLFAVIFSMGFPVSKLLLGGSERCLQLFEFLVDGDKARQLFFFVGLGSQAADIFFQLRTGGKCCAARVCLFCGACQAVVAAAACCLQGF